MGRKSDRTKGGRSTPTSRALVLVDAPPQLPLQPRRIWCRRLMSSNRKTRKTIAFAAIVAGVVLISIVGLLVIRISPGDRDQNRESLRVEGTPSQIGTSPDDIPAFSPSSTLVSNPIRDGVDHDDTDANAFSNPTPKPIAPRTPSPTRYPITEPTLAPVTGPLPVPVSVPPPVSIPPSPASATTVFYTIGDIPYNSEQSVILEEQMRALPADAEFVVHVGDLRYAAPNLKCRRSEYEDAARLLNISHAPVFVIKGDNDWTDCPNQGDGLRYWHETFEGFEGKYWDHTFNIRRQENRPDNFAFVHKGTFFAGLNLVGGEPTSNTEWNIRMRDQIQWLLELITEYAEDQVKSDSVGRIVLFGHANPNHLHNQFFVPLRRYIRDQLDNGIPMLYLNGDKHEWSYDPVFYNQESFLRMMVTGKGIEPPLRVEVAANGQYVDPTNAFVYDRMLGR